MLAEPGWLLVGRNRTSDRVGSVQEVHVEFL